MLGGPDVGASVGSGVLGETGMVVVGEREGAFVGEAGSVTDAVSSKKTMASWYRAAKSVPLTPTSEKEVGMYPSKGTRMS